MMYIVKVLVILFILVNCCSQGYGRKPYIPPYADPLSELWRFTHFSELDSKGIRCIVKDKKGNYWFGINKGIVKYDGYSFEYFTSLQGINGRDVDNVLVAKNGEIYATTSSGIFRYSSGKWTNFFPINRSYNFTFTSLRQLNDGSIACGISEGLLILSTKGVYLISNQLKSQFLMKQIPELKFVALPFNKNYTSISDFIECTSGNLWLAVSHVDYSKIVTVSLQEIYNGKINSFKIYSKESGIALGEHQKLLKSNDNKIWVINKSYKAGIYCYDGTGWKNIKLSSMFGGDEYCTSIAQGTDNTIWIGGLGKLYSFDGNTWKIYKSPASNIPSCQILMYPEGKDKLWIAGLQSKIFQVDLSQNSWATYEKLNYQCEDTNNNNWFISVDGKAVCHDLNSNKHFSYAAKDGFMDSPVKIICTKRNQLWAAGSHNGKAATAYFHNKEWILQLHPNLSWGIDYRSVFESKDGSIWFGGSVDFDKDKNQQGGLLELKDPLGKQQKWVSHPYQTNGLNQSSIYGIAQTKDNTLWIGGRSLLCLDKVWKSSTIAKYKQFINTIHCDQQGNLYVGSRYYGVGVYDGKHWKEYTTQNGLQSNTIISIATDNKNNVYAVTENDICYFDGTYWTNNVLPSEMNMSNEGGNIQINKKGEIWINHSTRDWKRRALSPLAQPAALDLHYKSYRYTKDNTPPQTKVVSFNKEVDQPDAQTFVWQGEDHMEKTPGNRLQYSYRINNESWSPFSENTIQKFTNLNAGKYVIEVTCRDLDFNIDPTSAKVEFTVLAPLWKRSWFIACVVLVISLLVFLEVRVLHKSKKLSQLNLSLAAANQSLVLKNSKIHEQKEVIFQNHCQLEENNHVLELKNAEINNQLKKLESMVEKVEVLSRSKVNFFTNITHEFRTPLTLIQGPIERLFQGQMSESEKQKWQTIVQVNIGRLRKLINQLIDNRDNPNGIENLFLRKNCINKFVEEITLLFKNLAENRSIELGFTPLDLKVNSFIYFDHDKVEKVLYNLLGNAMKYTQSGGKVSVALGYHLKGENPTPYIGIKIADTGCGISKENLEKIFERNNGITKISDKANWESSGIGLPHVKQLVEAHGGYIVADSTVNIGSAFEFLIPSELQTHEIKDNLSDDLDSSFVKNTILSPIATKDTVLNKDSFASVLVVEDNAEMMLLLNEIFNSKFNIVNAVNGIAALEICKNQEIDLIVSDIMMPELDGLSLCMKLKANSDTSHIPIILLTAKSVQKHGIQGYQLGADDYMEKPFNADLLLTRVENILNSRKVLQQKNLKSFTLNPKNISVVSEDEKLLVKLGKIMEENIADADFDIDRMCEMLNKSHVQFIRKIKQLTGKKPVDLLKTFRLQRAKQLLEQDKINISEVAWMVGYDLPNSFSRAFKKEFGNSPSEYLDSVRQAMKN